MLHARVTPHGIGMGIGNSASSADQFNSCILILCQSILLVLLVCSELETDLKQERVQDARSLEKGNFETSREGLSQMWRYFAQHASWPLSSFAARRLISREGEIFLVGQGLSTFPEVLLSLKNEIKTLDLSDNEVSILPDFIGDFQSLENLKMPRNSLRHLPKSLGKLRHLKSLDFGNNNIEELGPWIGHLTALRNLNLKDNKLRSIPEEIGSLTGLISLGLKSNLLDQLPRGMGNLKSLVHLFITDNQLTSLPADIGGCTGLRKIQASHNRLSELPDTMRHMEALEFLRLACNRFERFPLELFRALPALTWLALSGNPATNRLVQQKEAPRLGPPDLHLTGLGLK
ncbi:hypothetical protein CYMTET_15875, partial [Cymbomonas tetramitiformis]